MECDDLHRFGILRQNKGKSYEKILSQLSAVSHRQLQNQTKETIPTLNSAIFLDYLEAEKSLMCLYYLSIIDIMNNG